MTSTLAAFGRIAVNEIPGDVVTLFPFATITLQTISIPPVYLLSLDEIETKTDSLSISMSTVSQRTEIFLFLFLLFFSCLVCLDFPLSLSIFLGDSYTFTPLARDYLKQLKMVGKFIDHCLNFPTIFAGNK